MIGIYTSKENKEKAPTIEKTGRTLATSGITCIATSNGITASTRT